MATTTTFQRALDEYLQSLPSHKKKSKFLLACYNSESPVTPESLNDVIAHAEERASRRTSRRIIKKVLSPVVAALKEYFGVIDNLGMLVYLPDPDLGRAQTFPPFVGH